MAKQLFYSLDEPYKETQQSKKKYVAVRMERDLFLELYSKAKKQKSDLSTTIRELLKQGLQGLGD